MIALNITLTNEDRDVQFSAWREVREEMTNGNLFRELQREYGRCTSRIYVDAADGVAKPVGWFFISRQEYEGARRPGTPATYLRGAWVHVKRYPDMCENCLAEPEPDDVYCAQCGRYLVQPHDM